MASGSAYGEAGQSKVLLCIYGPRPSSERSAGFSDTAALKIHVKFFRFGPGAEAPDGEREQALAIALRQALEVLVRLERYPKSTIEVYVQVLQHDGALLSLALPLASLALIDAGIEVLDFSSAATVALLRGGQFVVDPDARQERAAQATLTVALMPALNEVIQCIQQGEMPPDQLDHALHLALDACSRVSAVTRSLISSSMYLSSSSSSK